MLVTPKLPSLPNFSTTLQQQQQHHLLNTTHPHIHNYNHKRNWQNPTTRGFKTWNLRVEFVALYLERRKVKTSMIGGDEE
jgi:hypothetical protein